MPRLGGLAIFISFIIGMLILSPEQKYTLPIIIGSLIIVITGVLDDMKELSAKVKTTWSNYCSPSSCPLGRSSY